LADDCLTIRIAGKRYLQSGWSRSGNGPGRGWIGRSQPVDSRWRKRWSILL